MYSISASLRRAAPECRTGTLTLVRTEPRMAASRRVQVPLCVQRKQGSAAELERGGGGGARGRKGTSHSGNKRPLKNAAGL